MLGTAHAIFHYFVLVVQKNVNNQ